MPAARRLWLQTTFSIMECDVVGVQESRGGRDTQVEIEEFVIVQAAGLRGVYGCELWFAKATVTDIHVVCQQPRFVAAVASLRGKSIFRFSPCPLLDSRGATPGMRSMVAGSRGHAQAPGRRPADLHFR